MSDTFLGYALWNLELDLMILKEPLQFRVFHHSMILSFKTPKDISKNEMCNQSSYLKLATLLIHLKTAFFKIKELFKNSN